MGSYASEPKVDKESLDEYNERLNCGASSMQGWRVTQEDAHNCILDYDTHTSFFAVYDGHGGHEVAKYCSQKLPEYIKNTEPYQKGDIETALVEGFLGFDSTITTSEVIAVLKSIAGEEDESGDSESEENVDNLYEEASMPIEQVIQKYTSSLVNPFIKNLKKSEKAPKSPYLKAKTEDKTRDKKGEIVSELKPETSGTEEAGSSSQTDSNSSSKSDVGDENSGNHEESIKDQKDVPKIEVTECTEGEKNEDKITPEKDVSNKKNSETTQNGDITHEENTTHIQENGCTSPKGKGKARMIQTPGAPVRTSPRVQKSPHQLYKKLLQFEGSDDDDSEDEEDVTFDGGAENSSDDESETVNNSHLEENSEDSSNEEEENEEDGDDDDEDEEDPDEEEDESILNFTRNMKDGPGSDSGCTAVVAVLKDNKLWVANAGDSRCVVCRKGKAVEMSFDHKPEDEPERERIVKAGGRVTLDGRVNNGLNLSRAIGDHAYKQNTKLGPREQMITALPDVKTLDINREEDEFIILACDGIWNFMSSQEVIDFVRPKIGENREKLSTICEELFDHCLAPHNMGDGTGCDNMTAIIVQFKTTRKRSASSEKKEIESNKRVKTDNESESNV